MLRNLDIEIDLCFTSRIPLKGWQGILSIICIKGQMKECRVEKFSAYARITNYCENLETNEQKHPP